MKANRASFVGKAHLIAGRCPTTRWTERREACFELRRFIDESGEYVLEKPGMYLK